MAGTRVCIACGNSAVPILYQEATFDLLLDEMVRGAVLVRPETADIDAPTWSCSQCGHEWGKLAHRNALRPLASVDDLCEALGVADLTDAAIRLDQNPDLKGDFVLEETLEPRDNPYSGPPVAGDDATSVEVLVGREGGGSTGVLLFFPFTLEEFFSEVFELDAQFGDGTSAGATPT